MKSPSTTRSRAFGLPGVPRDRPVPLWMLFSLLFVGVYFSHATLLRLPYYWDEAGYYIPAAWDFFRTGSLIPSTTLSNAHPPLPSIYLALWWKLGGMVPLGHADSSLPGRRDRVAWRLPHLACPHRAT